MEKIRLPLQVLYEDTESWFVEKSKPVAIILKTDEIAMYVHDYPKVNYAQARQICTDLEVGSFFWFVPGIKELQAMLDYADQIDQTAKLLGCDPLRKAPYWGSKKLDENTRIGLNLALEREEYLDVFRGAYLRPFMRL
jgi:hypothetical protein